MARLWQQIVKGETGQALIAVLALLVVGGLIIAPTISYASTSLKAGQIIQKSTSGILAADAGVEYALWHIKNYDFPLPLELQENINQMEVEMEYETIGEYSLYNGMLVELADHYDWVDVETELEWDEPADAYKYTITVTGIDQSTIHLEEVGARLPVGYSYQLGSAASFPGNESTEDPLDELDNVGVHFLTWAFGQPQPSVKEGNPPLIHSFYFTGEGSLNGAYSGVVAAESDVGTVGEVLGLFYTIMATATSPEDSEVTATVTADVMSQAGEISIINWQINQQ